MTVTDRVLAEIDAAIDGYVSEDWTVGDDAMRWRPEEPEDPALGVPWIAPEMWDRAIQYDAGASVVDWFSDFLDQHVAFYGLGERQAMEGAWCTSSRLDELPAGPMYVEGYRPDNEPAPDPHWDDSLTASLERTREGAPERSTFGSGRVTAPLGDALEVARRGQVEPMKEPLAVNWKVDPGKVTRKQGNRR